MNYELRIRNEDENRGEAGEANGTLEHVTVRRISFSFHFGMRLDLTALLRNSPIKKVYPWQDFAIAERSGVINQANNHIASIE